MSAIKGHTPQEIVLETRGGTIGEITLVISDEFQVLRGSQYLIIQDKSQLTSESESTWRIDRLIDPQNEKDQQLVKCLIAQSSTNDGGGK
jgi:hypothetical protein